MNRHERIADQDRVEEQPATGILYLVPTPIGNLEDITLRALRILREVKLILAEDTRHTGILCQRHQIPTPLASCHDHNWRARKGEILARLRAGEALALVSDAGTPGISDLAQPIVREVVAAGLRVEALPGATALIPALTASGLACERFVFEGFAPRQGRARWLKELAATARTAVCYESPRRLAALLEAVVATLGAERQVVVAREITKLHEHYHRGTAQELLEYFTTHPPLGEVVVILAGAPPPPAPQEEVSALLAKELAAGTTLKEAVARVTESSRLPRREVYQLALKINQIDK